MKIDNEIIVSKLIFNNSNDELIEDDLYIGKVTNIDKSNDNIEIAIHDDEKSMYIIFRFNDLKRIVDHKIK